MTKLNPTAVLAFYTARKRKGDANVLYASTTYSRSHILNVLAGRRTIKKDMAKELFNLSKSRTKNKDVAIFL
jgi:hypothetical protein